MTLPKLEVILPNSAPEDTPPAGMYPVELDGEKRMAVLTFNENREKLLKILKRHLGSQNVKYYQEDDYWHIPATYTPEKLQELNTDFVFTYAQDIQKKPRFSGKLIVLKFWYIYLILGLITSSISNIMIPSLTIYVSDPFLCSGEMQFESTEYQYMPGQSGISTDYYCIDEDGAKHYLSFFSIAGVTFTIHFLFFLILAFMIHLPRRLKSLRETIVE